METATLKNVVAEGKKAYDVAVRNLEAVQTDAANLTARAEELRDRIISAERGLSNRQGEKARALERFGTGAGGEAAVREAGNLLKTAEGERAALGEMLAVIERKISEAPGLIASARARVERAKRTVLRDAYETEKTEILKAVGPRLQTLRALASLSGLSVAPEHIGLSLFGPIDHSALRETNRAILSELGLME